MSSIKARSFPSRVFMSDKAQEEVVLPLTHLNHVAVLDNYKSCYNKYL